MSVAGNQNAAKGKRWKIALSKRIEALQAMDALAEALITEALTGNIQALKEIGDRLDGKSVQGVEVGGIDGEPIPVTTIRIVAGDGSNSPATA